MAEKILAHQTRPPKPIRELRPEVPEWLAGIIEKMMAKRPEDRYQTPGAVAAAVAGKGEGDSPSAAETVVEEPATSPETANLFPPDRPVRRSRRRLAFLLLGLVVLVGLAFCVGRWLLSDRNEAEVATPPSPSAVAVSTLPSQPSEKGTSGKGMSFSFPKSFAGNATVKRNGSAQVPASGVLRLTDKAGQAGSAFYNQKVDITRFTTTFDFRLTKPGGDGFTFTVQAVGPEAVGQAGGGLGYAGIAKSIAVKFDLYDNAGEGPNSTGVFTLGKAPTIGGIPPLQEKNDLRGTGINLHSEHTFTSAITYDGATLTLKITDKETKASITRSYKVNIPEAVGGKSAYVGFTGGTGGALAIQDILSWTFSSTPAP